MLSRFLCAAPQPPVPCVPLCAQNKQPRTKGDRGVWEDKREKDETSARVPTSPSRLPSPPHYNKSPRPSHPPIKFMYVRGSKHRSKDFFSLWLALPRCALSALPHPPFPPPHSTTTTYHTHDTQTHHPRTAQTHRPIPTRSLLDKRPHLRVRQLGLARLGVDDPHPDRVQALHLFGFDGLVGLRAFCWVVGARE